MCLSLLLTSCVDALAPVEAQNKDTQPQDLQDTDGDGITDNEDECPYNPRLQKAQNDKSCFSLQNALNYDGPEATGYHIYHVTNLIELVKALNTNNALLADLSEFHIYFDNDINFGDLENSSTVDSICVMTFDNTYPAVSLGSDQTSDNFSRIVIHGNYKRIISKKNVDGKVVRCSLPSAIFDRLTNCEVNDLILDYDVYGVDAQAMLANHVDFSGGNFLPTFNHITYSGKITKKSKTDNTSSDDAIGGLIAQIPYNNSAIFSDCNINAVCDADDDYCSTGLTITLDSNVETSVGALIGETEANVEIKDGNYSNITLTTKNISTVGGLIGSIQASTFSLSNTALSNLNIHAVNARYVGSIIGSLHAASSALSGIRNMGVY